MNNSAARQAILQAKNLHYSYTSTNQSLPILAGLNLDVYSGDSIAVVGASGSGKSTLLHVLGGLDAPQEGEVLLCGQTFASAKPISARHQGMLRNRHLGFVYQFHHLLAEFTALENVMMPLLVRSIDRNIAAKEAKNLLDKVGVGARQHHKPAELSGGERQRVAIARALVTQPDCLLADEPTGNLDTDTAAAVIQLLFDLQAENQTALVIVTHDTGIAEQLQTIYRLQDKRLVQSHH